MPLSSQVFIDGHWYYYGKGTYSEKTTKSFSTYQAVNSFNNRQEGGMNPTEWEMSIVCFTREELIQLSGSYIEVSPDSEICFSGRYLDPHMVYFDDMGPIKNLDRNGIRTLVPIKLTAIQTGR